MSVLLGRLSVEMMTLHNSSYIFVLTIDIYFLSALVIAAVFDRDVNCRRAASVSYHILTYVFLVGWDFCLFFNFMIYSSVYSPEPPVIHKIYVSKKMLFKSLRNMV